VGLNVREKMWAAWLEAAWEADEAYNAMGSPMDPRHRDKFVSWNFSKFNQWYTRTQLS